MTAWKPGVLMGRLANGNEADAGCIVHAVPHDTMHYGHMVAACGTQPGRRSGGWDVDNVAERAITCTRCVRKVSRNRTP